MVTKQKMVNLNNKKYILTSGCSFTDGFGLGETGSWPHYLSNKLDLKLINKARGGSGNEYISDSIIWELMNNPNIRNEVIVGVAWSDVSRLMISTFDGENQNLDTIQPQDFIKHSEGGSERDIEHMKCLQEFFRDIPFCVYKTYMSIVKLNHFLDSLNIPYFYIDAINPNKVSLYKDENNISAFTIHSSLGNEINFKLEDWPHQYRFVLNEKFNKTIFKNFIKINNYNTILEMMWTDYDKYENGNPGHPNHLAAKEIAESIYKQII
tara:strand:- start:1264 stop:2061 length:798 start_codon:yes stop_codon:yes gene_type:complete